MTPTTKTPERYQPVVQTYIKDCRPEASEVPNAIANPPQPGQGVRYAIAQGPSMVPHNEEQIEDALAFNYQTLYIACHTARQYNAQLLSFPELFLSGYEFAFTEYEFEENGAKKADRTNKETHDNRAIATAAAKKIVALGYPEKIQAIARETGITLICPMPHHGPGPNGEVATYDVAMIFFADDRPQDKQFKINLWGCEERQWFQFAQYPALSPENNYQNPTNPYRVHLVNGMPVGIGICYDAEFPENARALALNGSLLNAFPTAAPNGYLPGQKEPYPDISEFAIPASAQANVNFCSYSNRAGWELTPDGDKVLEYTGNSIICNNDGVAMVKAITNEDCLLIADCLREDIQFSQPPITNYMINRRPNIYGVLSQMTAPFPYGHEYQYHEDPNVPPTPLPGSGEGPFCPK